VQLRSVDKTDAHEVTEQHLGVFESRHKELVQWVLQHFLVHLILVHQQIGVDFHLNSQDRKLISSNFQLVWLAIEAQAVDWFQILLSLIFLVSCSNEGKLDV
jgi:hypothetical protein